MQRRKFLGVAGLGLVGAAVPTVAAKALAGIPERPVLPLEWRKRPTLDGVQSWDLYVENGPCLCERVLAVKMERINGTNRGEVNMGFHVVANRLEDPVAYREAIEKGKREILKRRGALG